MVAHFDIQLRHPRSQSDWSVIQISPVLRPCALPFPPLSWLTLRNSSRSRARLTLRALKQAEYRDREKKFKAFPDVEFLPNVAKAKVVKKPAPKQGELGYKKITLDQPAFKRKTRANNEIIKDMAAKKRKTPTIGDAATDGTIAEDTVSKTPSLTPLSQVSHPNHGSLYPRPVFPAETIRPIGNALIKARTAAVQAQQQRQSRAQQEMMARGRPMATPNPQ